MEDVAPRTVILRPMDIRTNVDATISDENLIICISGKNIDVNSVGFDKAKGVACITTNSPNYLDAELLQHPPPDLLENNEDEILDIDKEENNGAQVLITNPEVSVPKKIHLDLQNITQEKVEEPQDQYENTIDSSNTSSKEDDNVTVIEQPTNTDKNVLIEEINQTDTATTTDSIEQSNKSSQITTVDNTVQTVSPNKQRPKPPISKKYQAKSASPTRRTTQNYYSKTQISKTLSNNNSKIAKLESEINNVLANNKVSKTPISSPKRPKSYPTTNFPQKAKPLKLQSTPPSSPEFIEADEELITITNQESNSGDNIKNSSKHDDYDNVKISKQPPNSISSELNIPMNLIAKPHPFCQLDYVKIKHDLFHGTFESKLKILQALRWRLTRTDTKVRDHNLVCYVTHDLLDIGVGSVFFDQYFQQSKSCEPLGLQEEASRFINTLASMSMGREYLERCQNLIQILLPILMNFNGERVNFENLTRQFVMATIQKLSLCGRIRKLLINEGIVEWLIKYILINHKLMTDYEAEYSVALFSNLCIHKPMRDLCEQMADDTAQLLNVLVYTPHKCCLPYLSGILGSLLTNDTINKRAADLNIQAKLKYLAEIADDEETKQQLEFIIHLHETSSQNKCMYDVVEEPQVYSDYLECELGMNESNYTYPVGEKFLENYCASFPSLEKHVHVVKRSCNYGINQCQSELLETDDGNNKNASSEVVSPFARSKQMSKIEIFKDMFNQVPSPSPPLTTLCSLNYYNLNRPISIPVRYSSVTQSKYSCECYDEIKNILGEDTKPPRSIQNSGRKPNNVVYGPLISPKNYCSTLSVFPCDIKQCCHVKS